MSAIPSSDWQAGFLNVLPTVQTHAQIQFRHLPPQRREDAVQEAIAAAVVAYRRLVAQGRLQFAHASTIATNAVRFVRNGRHVGGRQDTARDVMSPACQRRRGVRVVSYQRMPPRSGPGNQGWQQLVIADRKFPIPDTAAFRIDFATWLKTLTHRDRRIIAAFIRGDGTMAVADKFGVTQGRVSQLRRQYQQRWEVFQKQAA